MAKLISWTCDVCGVEKKEANHWFLCTPAPYPSMAADDQTYLFGLYSWDEEQAEGMGHLCGEQCVLKKVPEVMGNLGK